MTGWKIFVHSLRMILSNLRSALQISLLGFTLTTIIAVAAYYTIQQGAREMFVQLYPFSVTLRGSVPLNFFLLTVLYIFVSAWVAVAWHRFVLLEEYPTGWVPAFHWQAMKGYMKPALILVVLFWWVYVPVLVAVIGPVARNGPIFSVLPLAVIVLTMLLLARIALIFPAAAMERRMSLAEAWRATKGATSALAIIIILLLVAQIVLGQVVLAIAAFAPIIGAAAYAVYSIGFGLLKISLLTTGYGYFVQKRDL